MANFEDVAEALAGGRLTIDLAALRANYELIAAKAAPSHTAAVVKADAYGLGAERVAQELAAAGCRDFFVAMIAEALALRPSLPANAKLYVLNGLAPGAEQACVQAKAIPVLNSLPQAERWRAEARRQGRKLAAVIQVDSGMSRLGFSADEIERLPDGFPADVDVVLVMSHLACADTPNAASNQEQLARFEALADRIGPGVPRSIANSAGVWISPSFGEDLVRPGLALYGASPIEGVERPVRPVVRLEARVIQLRSVEAGAGVGYGLTYVAPERRRLATISVGYADGWPRRLGGRAAAYLGEVRLPIVGRVSMDSMTLDVSAVPEGALAEGDFVELIGPHQSLETLAGAAETVAYEILTGLARRFSRTYLGACVEIDA
ncbi:alanine racemase [Phenylobacterium sp. Root77]|uniref:alanine racemase n=1 Tax=unclassified Phenylobacterium TaxID=2640670 RepID=UPI0007000F53|nr:MULTISPECIES: alanine racemase [unclassified Phenylobacterium]KQW71848.1 alanine racemase [Phenylobacterium sp. Root1277]KQW94768.1 alanine racemase [Phenylobacterium sp. Root1290]KRC44461.1 alanine racemase [Phenylobacterium sp. Root77]